MRFPAHCWYQSCTHLRQWEEFVMLRSINQLHSFALIGAEGKLGYADEVFFDDETWRERYLVADTGDWLLGRKTLIAMPSLGAIDWEAREIEVSLTTKQIESCPPLEEHCPISRQWQRE